MEDHPMQSPAPRMPPGPLPVGPPPPMRRPDPRETPVRDEPVMAVLVEAPVRQTWKLVVAIILFFIAIVMAAAPLLNTGDIHRFGILNCSVLILAGALMLWAYFR